MLVRQVRQVRRLVVGNGVARRGLAAVETQRKPGVLVGVGIGAAFTTAVGFVATTVFSGAKKGAEDVVEQKVQDWWNDPEKRRQRMLKNCAVPKIPAADEEVLVERKEVDDRIAAHVRAAVSSKYLVVVGPRGAGKSIAVKKVLGGRGAVVYCDLDSAFPTIHARLRKDLGDLPKDAPFALREVLRHFEGLSGVEKPVVVLELDSNLSAETIKEQTQELKKLCVDNKLAHGIVVLSDAIAVFKLNIDPGRQRLLWVGDLDEEQANAFLDKGGVLLRGDPDLARLRDRLLNEVGANAQDLFDTIIVAKDAAAEAKAAISGASDPSGALRAAAAKAAEQGAFEQFIEKKQSDAEDAVANLLTQSKSKDKFRRLLLALLENPAGVKQRQIPFSAKDASEEFKPKTYRAVTYNSETDVFQFYSKAHEHAARRWFENEATTSTD